ncbi:MAG: ribonuclease Z [Deltaproteobacteria bacterium]|nr:ribonuclease Z [Deltaproteobacteria bacterium]
MRSSFHPRLVNPPLEDPVLFVPFFFEKRAFLFDMGDLHRLPPKEILKLTHGFVTHTHMDHFVGFDALLRTFLGRQKTFHVFGPPGFLQQVEGKLASYTWNLVENYDQGLSLKATEVHPTRTISRVYECQKGFRRPDTTDEAPFDGTLLSEPAFSVHAVHLDHKIPCLGFSVQERFHVNIMKDQLQELGIPVGAWLREFKEALYNEQAPDDVFEVVWNDDGHLSKRTFRLGDLTRQIARISPGQKIAYIVDVVFNAENAAKIVAFTRNADHLFIEAAFLDVHGEIAQSKYHLTAKQAGTLAMESNVKQLTVFHFSPRYADESHLLHQEAEEAFTRQAG